ncbi:SIS domain-containing protein [candidate division WOR-3 bacterium]|nr:SIS domain-containing protein [candidate division WOR-3 bacterium]
MKRKVNVQKNQTTKEIERIIKDSIRTKESLFSLSESIYTAISRIKETLKNSHKILLVGNGGSAADAQHITAEFIEKLNKNRTALPAISLTTNTSVLTAVSNDRGFKYVFSRQVEAIGEKGDILILISTSGNSVNLIEASKAAKKMGILTIGLLGKGGGNLKNNVDLPIVVNSANTQRIQESHITIGHIIVEIIENELN